MGMGPMKKDAGPFELSNAESVVGVAFDGVVEIILHNRTVRGVFKSPLLSLFIEGKVPRGEAPRICIGEEKVSGALGHFTG